MNSRRIIFQFRGQPLLNDPGPTTTWPCQSRLCTFAKAKYALKPFDSTGDIPIDDRGNYIWRIPHFLVCHLLLRSLIGHHDASRNQKSRAIADGIQIIREMAYSILVLL
jgi:hypothetical protein